MLTHEHDIRSPLHQTVLHHACSVGSLPEGPTFVLMRSRTHRFSSGQNTFLYWRFTPCSFLILLCEKVTAQTVSILPRSSQKDSETTSSGGHLHTLQPPMSRDFRKEKGNSSPV